MKQAIRHHFDAYAGATYVLGAESRAYYEDQARYFRFLVPKGSRVLEIGSGLGTLLASVKPARGVSIDLSPEMVKEAVRRHPRLEFQVGDAETLAGGLAACLSDARGDRAPIVALNGLDVR